MVTSQEQLAWNNGLSRGYQLECDNLGLQAPMPGSRAVASTLWWSTSQFAGAATQVGVFMEPGSTSGLWTYPANMTGGASSPDTDDALTAPLIGTFATSPGSGNGYNDADGNANSTVGQLRLDPILVPEPSSIALVVAGLLGLLGLRRRS